MALTERQQERVARKRSADYAKWAKLDAKLYADFDAAEPGTPSAAAARSRWYRNLLAMPSIRGMS